MCVRRYTKCGVLSTPNALRKKRTQDTSQDGLWPKWFEPNSEFEVECSDHLPHEMVSKTLPCERGLVGKSKTMCDRRQPRDISEFQTCPVNQGTEASPSCLSRCWRSGLRECAVGAAFHPGHSKRRLVETGAVTTAEARQDCARLAQSRGAPICPLMATLSAKKRSESRRGDSIAASMRTVARDVAAKHGAEEAGFGLRMKKTHITVARHRGTWSVTPVGRLRVPSFDHVRG